MIVAWQYLPVFLQADNMQKLKKTHPVDGWIFLSFGSSPFIPSPLNCQHLTDVCTWAPYFGLIYWSSPREGAPSTTSRRKEVDGRMGARLCAACGQLLKEKSGDCPPGFWWRWDLMRGKFGDPEWEGLRHVLNEPGERGARKLGVYQFFSVESQLKIRTSNSNWHF